MKYIAHTSDDGREQSLYEHLKGTSELCKKNAIDPFKDYAELCGLVHDIGKYSKEFQERISGRSDLKVEHAICGAKELGKYPKRMYTSMLQYCISGHHSGLPDGGTRIDTEDMPTLHARLKRKENNYLAYKTEFTIKLPDNDIEYLFSDCLKKNNIEELIERYAFFTRYLFSCLTDADFIDTESFACPKSDRGISGDFEMAYELICKKLNSFECKTKAQRARGKIQEQVYKSIESNSDIYALDMPTGSGKTLCSMRAALELALRNNKQRIIYVIPYVSVIEQTANVFENVFGSVLPVIQHHSGYNLV